MGTGTRLPIRLLLFLAWKGLLQNRVIAVLLCAAVAGGVAFQIPNAANLGGYEAELFVQGLAGGLGDIRVRPREEARIHDADAFAATLASRPGVLAAVPVLMVPGAVGKKGNFKTALILGIDPDAQRVPFRLIEGKPLSAGDSNGVVVGTTIANRVGTHVGDEVQLRVIFGGGGEEAGSLTEDIGKYTMTVRGLAAGTFLGAEAVVVDRGFLMKELGEPHGASAILVHLADHFAAPDEAIRIEHEFPKVEARAWADDSPFLNSALKGSAAIRLVSRAMVVLAVLIPVWALLYVHVLHRKRQIAILGALGFGRSEIFRIYLAQAAIVGVVGALVGCLGGYGLVIWFSHHPIFRSPDFVIRPLVSVYAFALPSLMVFVATLAAGVVPAWRAARLDPAQMMRGAE